MIQKRMGKQTNAQKRTRSTKTNPERQKTVKRTQQKTPKTGTDGKKTENTRADKNKHQ